MVQESKTILLILTVVGLLVLGAGIVIYNTCILI